jgi:2-methylcitrate dehydratase PrpD
MDPAARALMEKITAGPDYDFSWQGEARLTVVKKSGEKLVRETRVRFATPLTRQEIIDKFNRVCGFRSVSTEQRDRAREQWLNLRNIRDIAEPMQTLAKFGNPQPL